MNAAVAIFLENMAATPNPCSDTSGHRCPLCGAPLCVRWGRHSKAWFAFHGMNPYCADSSRWLARGVATQAEAVEACRQAAEEVV